MSEKVFKLFISQPMRDKTEAEIRKAREEAIAICTHQVPENESLQVIDSYIPGLSDGKPLKSLAKSLEMMADADLVYFARGWETARGCRIEYAAAVAYGIDTLCSLDPSTEIELPKP